MGRVVGWTCVLFAMLFVPLIVQGKDAGCFQQKGSDIEYTGTCSKDETTVTLGSKAFSIVLDYPKEDVTWTEYIMEVAGCKWKGHFEGSGQVRIAKLYVEKQLIDFPAMLTVNETSGFVIDGQDLTKINGVNCSAPVFNDAGNGKVKSDVSIELLNGTTLPKLTMVIKDAAIDGGAPDENEKDEEPSPFPAWAIAVIVGSLLAILVAVGGGIGVWCYCRNKAKKQEKDGNNAEGGEGKETVVTQSFVTSVGQNVAHDSASNTPKLEESSKVNDDKKKAEELNKKDAEKPPVKKSAEKPVKKSAEKPAADKELKKPDAKDADKPEKPKKNYYSLEKNQNGVLSNSVEEEIRQEEKEKKKRGG